MSGSGFKFNPQGMRDLETQIQQTLEREIAPQVQRERLDPLRDDLAKIAGDPPTDKDETRRLVRDAYARHQVTPGADIDELVEVVHEGGPVPDIKVRVERPRLT